MSGRGRENNQPLEEGTRAEKGGRFLTSRKEGEVHAWRGNRRKGTFLSSAGKGGNNCRQLTEKKVGMKRKLSQIGS